MMIRNILNDVKHEHRAGDRDGDSHSSVSGERNPNMKKKRITADSFASILSEVIETPGYDDAIYWSEDGKSFRVIPKTFTEKVLDRHMKGTKFSSFFRRLIRWGFERVVLDEFPMNAFVFRHEMFQRGQASLLRTLSPYHVSRGKRSNAAQQSGGKAKMATIKNSETTTRDTKASDKVSAVSDESSRESMVNQVLFRAQGLLTSSSLAIPPQLPCADTVATLELLRRQQQQQQHQQDLLLLSQLTNNLHSSAGIGLERNISTSLLPSSSSLLTGSRFAQRNTAIDSLACEMQLRDLLCSRARLSQEPSLSFAHGHNLPESLAPGEAERLTLLSMLLQQSPERALESSSPEPYDKLFRWMNLMNRLQE
ncbi:hypothetical protein FisN_26Lh114 [Fistulifera solaris]|uniref:HSF-type DNA-binding domain-containing protein n=1 Tax=Fistulifera solaris TaxID=1519565 RepID=A0A1Z5KCQ3_FISSO|nr:hypothetical protein FisN_26Lh114 [Fistulifera solaris]|eukprot:GAX24043.1 hypothetical protein FisN_26Lh114 [Fistulifera solaris]